MSPLLRKEMHICARFGLSTNLTWKVFRVGTGFRNLRPSLDPAPFPLLARSLSSLEIPTPFISIKLPLLSLFANEPLCFFFLPYTVSESFMEENFVFQALFNDSVGKWWSPLSP